MRLDAFIEGLKILEMHYAKPDGFHLGAEHDQFYMYATETPLSEAEAARMFELGWFQEGVEGDEDSDEHAAYAPEEGWSCFV